MPEGIVADATTRRVAVGVRQPNAVVLVDADTTTERGRVLLPGHLRHLQLSAPGGAVLVPDEDSDSLITVALPDGTVTGRVHTGSSPHDATVAGNGLVFVANEAGASVAVVSGTRVAHTFTDVAQPAGLAAVGDLVGLVDVRQNTLHVYDAARLTSVAQIPAGQGPTHLVGDRRGRLVVADTRGNALLIYGLTPQPHQIGRTDLAGTPYGIAYDSDRDRLWVTLTAINQLVCLDASTSTPMVIARYPTVRQPNTVAVDQATGRVFVTGTADGVLEVVDG